MIRNQKRYKPNPKWNGRKERDGFVCSFSTKRKGSPFFCVAVKRDENGVHVRDTKDAEDTTLSFTNDEWKAFIEGVKGGEFDV